MVCGGGLFPLCSMPGITIVGCPETGAVCDCPVLRLGGGTCSGWYIFGGLNW